MIQCLFLLISLAAHVIGELVLSTTPPVHIGTADYFASRYPAYHLKELEVVLIDKFEPHCRPVLPNTPPSNDSGKGKLLVVDCVQAFNSPIHCHNFRFIAEQVRQQWTGSIAAMAFATSKRSKGYSGGPRKYYMADSVYLPQGPPPYPTVHINNDGSAVFFAAIHNATTPLVATSLIQDIGPWNRVYRSALFGVVVWMLFILCGAVLGIGMYRLYVVIRQGQFDYRRPSIAIFLIYMVLAVLAMVQMHLVPQSMTYYLVNVIVMSTSNICLFAILLLWIRRLESFGIRLMASQFLFVLYGSIALATVGFLLYVLPVLIPKQAHSMDLAFAITKNVVILLVFSCMAMFTLTAAQFMHHVDTLTPRARKHVSRLALINCVAAITLFWDGVAQVVRNTHAYGLDNPRAVLTFYVGVYVRHVMRVSIILLLFPLRPPSNSVDSK